MLYRGWDIHAFKPRGSNTTHYTAKRSGVSMNTNTLTGIEKMIDQRATDAQKHGFFGWIRRK